MSEVREESARTGEAPRWFAYTLALVCPWITLGITGPWSALVTSCVAVGFWLWWVRPAIGLNRRPITWLATFVLIFLCAVVALVALDQLQNPHA